MQKKLVIVINVIVLVIVIFVSVFMAWEAFSEADVVASEECIDVNNVASFVYESCYDAYTQAIFLKVRRSFDTYRLNAFEFSFFDFSEQSYKIVDVPDIGESRAYKIPSEKNPQTLKVALNIVKDFSASICSEPRSLFVKYCPTGSQEDDVNVSISPLEGVPLGDFVEVERFPGQESDIFSLSLVEKERVWSSKCQSSWECSAWEECENGVRRRECKDSRECFIPTDMPDRVEYCDGACHEEWECEWASCSNGFTTPKCNDLNKCGSFRDMPKKLSCSGSRGCIPEISCTAWSDCDVDYNFGDLGGSVTSQIEGTKRRICVDKNKCGDASEEIRSCSVGIDVYTRRLSKCGSEFIGVYDRLNNDLLVRLDKGTEDNPHLNIRLGEGVENIYCDYCFDGVVSGDETAVDCGGSCEACSERYKSVVFEKKTWWGSFINWIKQMMI